MGEVRKADVDTLKKYFMADFTFTTHDLSVKTTMRRVNLYD